MRRATPCLILVCLALSACGPTDETIDAVLFPPIAGVRTKVYEDKPGSFHLVVRDTRKMGSYLADAAMDARASAWCAKHDARVVTGSRGKSYMLNDVSTDLWFTCVPVNAPVQIAR